MPKTGVQDPDKVINVLEKLLDNKTYSELARQQDVSNSAIGLQGRRAAQFLRNHFYKRTGYTKPLDYDLKEIRRNKKFYLEEMKIHRSSET